jgi:hypothetical protein
MIRSSITPIILAFVTVCLACTAPSAHAQTPTEGIPDSLFVPRSRQPISYYTSYDRNISRAAWVQTLSWAQYGSRFSLNIDGAATTVNALRGLKSDGLDGDFNGSVNFQATKAWSWSLDGRFGINSTNDDRSTTDRRQNKLQLRTQYKFSPLPKLTAMALGFAEFQREQSVGDKTIPVSRGAFPDSLFAAHASHDSSYTSGRRDGATGMLTWNPQTWLEIGSTGATTSITSTVNTLKRDFWVSQTVGIEDVDSSAVTSTTTPNGDDRLENHVLFTGKPGTKALLVLKGNRANQQYYSLTQRDQEVFKYGARAAVLHVETLPFSGASATLDGGLDRSYQDYKLQSRLNRTAHGANVTGNLTVFRAISRANVSFTFTRSRNEKTPNDSTVQTEDIITRAVNLGGGRRVSRRLWLDGGGAISLLSNQHDDVSLDSDKLLGNVTVGGGYLATQQCSTSVHFSVNRSHDVAISYLSSGGNNVRTTYQMDATVRLKASRTLTVLQNYLINANYAIFDYNENANTLNRIRRIDTTILDSLFSFAVIQLTHNFQFQDRGRYTRDSEGEPRAYAVAEETYAQSLNVGLSIRVANGVIAAATQSLANTRVHSATPGVNDTNRNRWNLNLGLTVDRELPGELRLNGVIQRIGEYTERPGPDPPQDVVDYWLAGVTLMKDF